MNTPTQPVCPACGDGVLRIEVYSTPVEYKGAKGNIRQYLQRCSVCNAELFDEACSRLNRRAYTAFQKSVDDVPTGKQIKALRKSLGLSSEEAGRLLGGGPKAFSKYENDEIVPRGAMRTLFRFLLKYPERIAEVLEANGHKLHEKPRQSAAPVSTSPAAVVDPYLSTGKAITAVFGGYAAVLPPVELHFGDYEMRGYPHDPTAYEYAEVAKAGWLYPTSPSAETPVAMETQIVALWSKQRAARA